VKMTGQESSAGGTAGKVVRFMENDAGEMVENPDDLADPNVDMMRAATYSGWDFGSTWVLDQGGSFAHFQFRYPEGVRGVWGTVYDDGGALPVAVDEPIVLYVNTNPLDETGLGVQVDRSKSAADGMYYFVMGKNDVQATDWVIGKVEGYGGLQGNTRALAETGSIMGLDIWGSRARILPHAYRPVPVQLNIIEMQRGEEAVSRSLSEVTSGVLQLESSGGGVWSSPSDVEIQDETFSETPEMEWLDEQVQGETFTLPVAEGSAEQENEQEADRPDQPSFFVEESELPEISFYENSEPGREPLTSYTMIQPGTGVAFSQPRGERSRTLLSLAAEALQASDERAAFQAKDSKFASLSSLIGGNNPR